MNTASYMDDYHHKAVAELMEKARERRREALRHQMHYVVTTTRDGVQTEDRIFDAVPRLDDLMQALGPDAFLVTVRMERVAMRPHDHDHTMDHGLRYAAE